MFRALTSATSAAASTGTRGFFVSFDAMRFTTSFDPVKMFKATRAASYLCIKKCSEKRKGRGKVSLVFSREGGREKKNATTQNPESLREKP